VHRWTFLSFHFYRGFNCDFITPSLFSSSYHHQSSAKDSLQRFADLKSEKEVGYDVVNGMIVFAEKDMTPK